MIKNVLLISILITVFTCPSPSVSQTFQTVDFRNKTVDVKKIERLEAQLNQQLNALSEYQNLESDTPLNADSVSAALDQISAIRKRIEEVSAGEEPRINVRVRLQGAVQSAFKNEESGSTTGLFGADVERDLTDYVWTTRIGVAPSRDVVTSAFASSVLIPVSGGSAFESGLLQCMHSYRGASYKFWEKEFWKYNPLLSCFSNSSPPQKKVLPDLRVYIYGSASNVEWQAPEGGLTSGASETLSVITLGLGLDKALIPPISSDGNSSNNAFSLAVNVGPAFRILTGADSNDFYTDTLGSPTSSFTGLEGGFEVGFNELIGELHFFYFPPEVLGNGSNSAINGFQVTAGLSIQIDTFRFSAPDPQ